MSQLEDIQQKILQRKEQRWLKQLALIKKYKTTLLIFKFNIPGWPKTSEIITKAFSFIYKEFLDFLVKNKIDLLQTFTEFDVLGPEVFMLIKDASSTVKELAILFEETNTIGRLLDIDVITKEGGLVERSKKRVCFVCNESAIDCMRMRRHRIQDLRDFFDTSIKNYLAIKTSSNKSGSLTK